MKATRALIVMAVCFLGTEAAMAEKYYRWMDAEGGIVISNEPPVRVPRVQLPALDKKLLRPQIRRVAAITRTEPKLLEAIITHESGFRPQAVSPKGAMGLMQLMPGTARNWGVEDPFDPIQNLMGGARYLKYLLGLFNDDLSLAVAAYHSGEDRVMKIGAIPPIEATRNYVLNVLRTYATLSASSL